MRACASPKPMNRPALVTAKELRPEEKSRMRWRVERMSPAAKCSQRFIRSEQLLTHSETERVLELSASLIMGASIRQASQICTQPQAFARSVYPLRPAYGQGPARWPQ